MQIVDNRVLLLRTRNPGKFNVIPKSRVLDEVAPGIFEVAVHWGLDEACVMRNLGVRNVPSPIKGRYDWPGRWRPMAHQIETAAFLTFHQKAFVFSDPGVGKTMSCLWAADYLMRIGAVRRVLVLCPMSIMHSAWMNDLTSSVVHRSAIVAHNASSKKRIEMVQGDYDFVIMNYEGLPMVAREVVREGDFDLVIVDEANAVKNVTTRRWKAVKSVLTPETRLWLLTGTPASQTPLDAYGLARLVNPSAVPNYVNAWRDKVMNKITTFKWAPKADAKETVFNVLQPAIRFTKEQCLDLPPVVKQTRVVELTPQQLKYYKLIKDQMLAQASGETITAVNKAAVVTKLLQVSAGAALTDMGEVVEFDCRPRLNTLMEVLDETDRKVLIFTLFRASITSIVRHLRDAGISTEEIHGSVSATKRGQIINQFQHTDDLRVLVLQPQAAAHGITLTAADTVLFYGPLTSAEQYMQAIARADRKGQSSDKVRVIHIQGSPIEEKMFKAMDGKVDDHRLLADMFDSEFA